MAGYIGTQAVSVNTTSATISDDLVVGDDATITGDLDVDGTSNLDVVDIDGAVDMASTLQVDGAITSNGLLTVDGSANSSQAIFTGTSGRGLEISTFSVGAADEGVKLDATASGTTGKIILATNGNNKFTMDGTGDIILAGTSNADEANKSFNLQMLSHDTNEENVNILQVENEGAFNQISLGGGTSALNCATAIRFMTGNIDTTSGTERMRLSSAGHLYFSTGGTDPSGSQTGVRISGINGQNFFISANGGTSGYDQFAIFNGNGRVGSITTENSGTSFTTSSDHRLKENVVYNWDATTRLKQLKPARFNFIVDADTTVDGFLAHEAQAVVPECVSGTHNGTKTLTNVVLSSGGIVLSGGISQSDWTAGKSATTYPSDSTWAAEHVVADMQGIDQAKIVPLLVKAIQELEARIATLEG